MHLRTQLRISCFFAKSPITQRPHYIHGTKFDRAKSTIFAHPELICSDRLIHLNLSEIIFPVPPHNRLPLLLGHGLLNFSTYILTHEIRLNPFDLLNHSFYLFIAFRQATHPHTATACPHRFSTIPFSYPIIPGNNQAAFLLHKLCTALLIQKFL